MPHILIKRLNENGLDENAKPNFRRGAQNTEVSGLYGRSDARRIGQ